MENILWPVLALRPHGTIEKFIWLLVLRQQLRGETMNTSENLNELAQALASAQSEMKAARMNAVNPFLKTKYADLSSVIDAIKQPLAHNGLSFVQMPFSSNGEMGVQTRLMHSSGQWMESQFSLPMNEERGKSMAQVAGSVITYLRRYALSAMLGVVADEDADGNDERTEKRPSPRKKSQPQKPQAAKPKAAKFAVGDWVRVQGKKGTNDGKITAVNGVKATVKVEGVGEFPAPFTSLTKINKPAQPVTEDAEWDALPSAGGAV